MRWVGVITGLRQKGFSDRVIAEYSRTTEENIGIMAKGKVDPSSVTGMMLRRMEFKVRGVERKKREAHARAAADRPPKPVVPAAPRDVYEEPLAAEGYRDWRVVTSTGLLAIELRVHESFIGRRDIVRGLRAWLNEEDRILEVIRGGDSA